MKKLLSLLQFVMVAVLLCGVTAKAETNWDLSMPWGPAEFHVINAQKFAEAVKQATNGEVIITVHPGASLGIKGPESLAAVADGLVPMAEMAGFQQVGDEPILGFESLPYLVDDYDQLALLYETIRPTVEAAFARHNQKVLYIVPWPSQNFFTKKELNNLDDLAGIKMRTYDKNSTELMTRLDMTPVQIPSPDVVPSLASGKLDAVMTSTTTAAAQKYWEFLSYVYPTNHLWASNMMTVNSDAWNSISAEHQQAIEALAKEMEPQFWEVSKADHAAKLKVLTENGMAHHVPAAELVAGMRAKARPMWDEFASRIPEAKPVLDSFLEKTGKQ